MKRVLSLILAISMVMSMFTFSFAGTTLTDVDGTDYEAAVEALVELGIVNGYEDGTYRPEQNVSRAEMAKLLVVAAGLEPAAKLAEGATKFADVNGGWASGYVNVASEYGYVMGDPDGNFRPDDTVSYAEAATMALRVLGYKSVVEAKGTWPTNYIAKAEDLELLEDITYASYSDGAARGNVAILMWNMLRTQMWDVVGESEGDGLQYQADRAMLNVKFPDYSYALVNFDSFVIDAGKDAAEVMVTLRNAAGLELAARDGYATYEYVGNDFYTFVEGTEVEVLVNEEDELLLTMVPTGSDKLVEGSKLTLDEDYDNLDGVGYTYAYAEILRKDINRATLLGVSSEYIYEKTVKEDKYVKLNKLRKDYDDFDYEIILKDGERATLDDIEVGDVLSTVNVSNGETFYVVSRAEAEGKLTKYVVKDFENYDGSYDLLTVGGEDYVMDPAATYVEDPEDADEKQNKSFAKDANDDMRGEVVTLIRDFMGRVVRVEFDGSIDEDSKEVKFFTVTEEVEKEGIGSYVIGLENENESDTFKFAKSCDDAKYIYAYDYELVGTLVVVELNDDGEIKTFLPIASAREDDVEDSYDNIPYADPVEEPEKYYTIDVVTGFDYNEDDEAIIGDDDYSTNVDESVVVISLLVDDEDEDNLVYSATYDSGLAALEDLKAEEDSEDVILVIKDNNDTFQYAKYVVRFDEIKDREEDLVGIVDEVANNKVDKLVITIDDVTYTFEGTLQDVKEGDVVLFAVETDEDEETTTLTAVLTTDDFGHDTARVTDASESAIKFSNGTVETFKDSFMTEYEDYLFVRVAYNHEENEFESVEDPVLGADVNAKFFSEDDLWVEDTTNDVVWVVEGFDNEEAPELIITMDEELTAGEATELLAEVIANGYADKAVIATIKLNEIDGVTLTHESDDITVDGNVITFGNEGIGVALSDLEAASPLTFGLTVENAGEYTAEISIVDAEDGTVYATTTVEFEVYEAGE